jgi:1-acyl-sn-glycerol-3-phosphate acyltransferase
MLNLDRLERLRLSPKPLFQRAIAWSFLVPNYTFLPGVDIVFDGFDRLPNEPVIFAMNHTDRFNYFPFQVKLWRDRDQFTATWVKGKYYENLFVGTFLELSNQLPTVSRGYLITRDFLSTVGRVPSDREYETLRRLLNAAASPIPVADAPTRADTGAPDTLFHAARDMLGRPFDPSKETYETAINDLFRRMMKRFVELHDEAFQQGLHVLIFPQGTRSIRLSQGHIGLAEIALKTRRPIVPVGCNGSDKVYPTSSPLARKGRVVYRFGDPIRYEEISRFHIAESFEPFTAEAEHTHRAKFRGLIDLVMSRVNELVEPEYRFGDGLESDGVQGTSRFV